MLSKDKKELENALRKGSIQEIKYVFGKSSQPLEDQEVVKVLRLLLGRSNFDYEMVQLLKKHHCDLNAPLGDLKNNPDQYRIGDYLAAYGRLSPRLIDEMAKAGYDFSKTNAKGEHVGFYLIANSPINEKIVAALKSKGVDFSKCNNMGQTASEMMVFYVKKLAANMFLSHPANASIRRLSPLYKKQQDMIKLVRLNKEELGAFIKKRIDSIKPNGYETVGIQRIYADNAACQNLALHAKESIQEQIFLEQELHRSFVSNCTPGALKKLGIDQNLRS